MLCVFAASRKSYQRPGFDFLPTPLDALAPRLGGSEGRGGGRGLHSISRWGTHSPRPCHDGAPSSHSPGAGSRIVLVASMRCPRYTDLPRGGTVPGRIAHCHAR